MTSPQAMPDAWFSPVKHFNLPVLYLQDRPLPHVQLPEGQAQTSFVTTGCSCFFAGWTTPTWATS